MAFIVNDMRRVMSLRIKERQDDMADQYCRVFLVKICLVSGLVTGFDFFHDRVACMVPGTSTFVLQTNFVPSACWIQGFYIYEELAKNSDDSGYFGIPSDLSKNGIKPDGSLCNTNIKHLTGQCTAMTKTYFMHYQVIPFYLSGLAMILYLPYFLYVACNVDIQGLKGDLKKLGQATDAGILLKVYFNPSLNSNLKMKLRIFGNVLVKVGYLTVTLLSFQSTNAIMYDRFYDYGLQWATWLKLSAYKRFTTVAMGGSSPGNRLVPSMGICDIHETSLDERTLFSNRNIFVCELSPHVLYQYVLLIFWIVLVVGIVVSTLGIIHKLLSYVMTARYTHRKSSIPAMKDLTLREMEYLDYIRQHNLLLYADTLTKLQQRKKNLSESHGDTEPLSAKDSYL